MEMSGPSGEQVIQGAQDAYDNFLETERDSKAASQNQLVWYAGMAGYAVFNGSDLWAVLLGRAPTDGDLFWLAGPWALAGATAVLTHWVALAWVDSEHKYYYAMRAVMARLKFEQDPAVAVKKLDQLLTNPPKMIAQFGGERDRIRKVLMVLKVVTLVLLLGSFVWSIWGPFRLR